ncbi:MAG: hypothetical protein QN193_11565 [Armatimonadota bacterium]|nr:hypothetical protein [Armatimonadota bacterium]MDR7444702.1 hypothetical protein [Armatimonadota bacterium]MDR7571233.1 hypothetical protein [Armatimonadota bacterium]MDR7613294.1 hypothetical protein [Armatimonadota bacterium]
MLPDLPALTRCHGCGQLYWLEDAEQLGELDVPGPGRQLPEEWYRAPLAQAPGIEGYAEALRGGLASGRDREQYLRVRLWWAINDLVRGRPGAQIPAEYRDLFYENLRGLFALLDEDNPNERVPKAEVARQAGDFAEALRLLEEVPPGFQWAANVIRELARRGDANVALLNPDGSYSR